MVQLFAVATAYGAMTAAAAIDAGIVPDGERVLLAANATRVPETADDYIDLPQLRAVHDRFDRVERLNDLVAPILPTQWQPRVEDMPMLERLLRRAWGLGDGPVELYLQNLQVPPARTLAAIFVGSSITVIGDGLMTYSPIRARLPRDIAGRVTEVAYADVVPGVTPALFTEVEATRVPVAVDAFRGVLDEVSADVDDPQLETLDDGTPTALVLGQYLADLGILTAEEEADQQREMIDIAARSGAERIVFKPHPAALPSSLDAVRRHAAETGRTFVVHTGPAPAEAVAARLRARSVVAGFSSALPTVHALYGTPVASVGNAMLLHRLNPFENSNRVPVTLVDALTRPDSPYTQADALQQLVDTVAYCMQPKIMRHLRPTAERFLAAAPAIERERYFTVARLTQLGLPGGAGRSGLVGSYSRWEQSQLAAAGIRRRIDRAWKVLKGA